MHSLCFLVLFIPSFSAFSFHFFRQTLSKVHCRSHLDAISYAIQIETKKKLGRKKKRKTSTKNYEKLLRQVLFFDISASSSSSCWCYCHSPWKENDNEECRERSLNLKLDGNVVGKLRWLQTGFNDFFRHKWTLCYSRFQVYFRVLRILKGNWINLWFDDKIAILWDMTENYEY